MKKFLVALFSVLVCSVVAMCAACKKNEEHKKPEKLKDGIALALTVGASQNVDLSEYISIEGTEYVYAVSSSNDGVVTATLDENTATITAVSKGSATVTASADEVSVSFTVTVNEKQQQQPEEKPAPVFNDVNIAYDLKDVDSKSVTLTPKTGSNTFSYTFALKEQDDKVKIEGNKLTVSYDETVEKQLTVVATYTDSENASAGSKTVDFKLNIEVTDTREPADPTAKYKVVNGSFDNDLEGWTMVGEMGEISEKSTFWSDDFPIFNNGKYFSGETKESGTGTLTSSSFEVGGINKISFKLGAAGNSECYITLEKEDGTVLAIWRNTKFEDVSEWSMEEIGKTQFACNLVTYVADLTAYEGETLKIVLHDNADSGFGFFNFDELVTYYAAEAELPEGAVAVVNELADKTALKTALDNALTSQGDYTDESYNAYTAKVAAAQAIYEKISATQAEVDSAKTAIETAFAGLVIIVPEEVDGAEKTLVIFTGNSKEITISDYVDAKNLSGITYEVSSGNDLITAGEVEDGKFTVTAGNEDVEGAIVTITVKYNGNTVLTVEITVTVTNETAPTLKKPAVTTNIDLYSVENKTDITLDFASNVENVGELELTYTVTLKGSSTPLPLEGTSYTYTYGTYSETATDVVFNVTVGYGEGKSKGYVYTLIITDTTAYRVVNGGFDEGLVGWTLNNNKLGGVNSDETYWVQNVPFNNDGKFFNAYFEGCREEAIGTLTSSPFIIGGSGFITYKLGGARHADKVFLDIVEKDTGNILARYYNNAFFDNPKFDDDTDNFERRGCTLVAYKADLSAHIGKTVYIRISDNGITDYGLFFVDSFVTYNTAEPAAYNEETKLGFKVAVPVGHPETIYDIYNGDFGSGLDGWTLSNPNLGGVNNAKYYWGERVEFDAVGKFFNAYTNLQDEDAEVAMSGDEGAKGTLTSSAFTIGGSGWITYRIGGAKEKSLVYIEIVDSTTQEVLDRFGNELFSDADLGGCKLIKYKADLSAYIGRTVVIRITDNASENYGLFFADEFCTYYAQAPGADYNTATSYAYLKYQVANSSFETGNLDGWTMTGDIGFISSANGYWGNENENIPELLFQKDGNFLFEGFEGKVTEGEGRKTGSLTSSTFVLGGSGFITFCMGAASHPDEQYFEVVDASNGAVLGRYTNTLYVDAGNAGQNGNPDKVSALTLIKYKVDLHEHVGKTLYVRIVDNHVGGGIGMIMFDNVETYYVSADDIGSGYTLTENKIVA